MALHLRKATVEDSKKIHQIQIDGFKNLLEKYKDYDTNPGAETIDKVKARFDFDSVDQYFICLNDEAIGYLRVYRVDVYTVRLSQMFILPAFQGNGYAQAAMAQVEKLYPNAATWTLDTIKQEPKLRHLYEKMGYKLTGAEKNIKQGMDIVYYEKTIRNGDIL